jgi:hypothetical protein
MSDLKGTNIAGPVVPFTSDDTYATHLAKYGKGGFRSVQNINERNSIPEARREEGMLVYVIEDPDKINTYQYINGEWLKSKIGSGINKVESIEERDELIPESGDLVYVNDEKDIYMYNGQAWEDITVDKETLGIPIYDMAMVADLEEKEKLPEDYIVIPSKEELNYQGSRLYQPGDDGTYLDILFSAIRSLQAEVAKLRNSFKYGMFSYTGKETAMSAVMSEWDSTQEVEPLWAVEESDLSPIDDVILDISDLHTLIPTENVIVSPGALEINSSGATWNDDRNGFLNIKDPKLFIFMTTSGMNFKVKLKNLANSSDILEVDFSKLGVPVSVSGKYNVLFVVSRSAEVEGEYYGDNFVWISVANYATGISTNEGFWGTDNKLTPGTRTLGNNRYTIESVEFKNLSLYKFDAYSKFQDFTNTVSPNKPSDEDYKYKVAHITIRSVSNRAELDEIAKQLPKNELIYNEATNGLLIKTEKGIKEISGGGSSPSEDGMEKSEIIEWLAENGIIVTDDGSENIRISNIADITFIHQGSGKVFKFEVDSSGQLKSTELPEISLEDRMRAANFELGSEASPYTNIRGFVGELGFNEQTKVTSKTKDLGLYSDRIKIGSIYAPMEGQKTFGCSHAFVELENTSDRDFQLSGCYLHYATGICTTETSGNDAIKEYSLALTGVIPAGGTYLIRGKQYSDFEQANVFVKVDSFDQEWYVAKTDEDDSYNKTGTLIDFTLHNNNSWCLTYGLPGKDIDSSSNFSFATVLVTANSDTATQSSAPYCYHPRYIDSVSVVANVTSKKGNTWFGTGTCFKKGGGKNFDCIYKNTFELDPAKQAYQALNIYDSSRFRNDKAQDYQYVLLSRDTISFPKTEEYTFEVSKYTPKASYEHKNVCTDKSKLDIEKPNMVTISFGRNIHTTRCFNWISCGLFDEYIWVRKKGTDEWARFESYKSGTENDKPGNTGITKVTFGTFNNKTTGDENCSIQSIVYDRITGVFPGAGTKYTSHKCILNLLSEPKTSGDPEEYEYKVGRADINGNPDPNHVSDIQTFKLCPTTYTPRIFQITDQQGFHWIEYQVWAAAAKELNKTIAEEVESNNIIPILINTGDMTQNGTRVNEWFDYYNAGKCLFDHLEQMNVVGNNDLCGPDPEILGTGDDVGKSNSFYFHVFYCYEIDPEILPIISNANATHYIPSLYYFGNTASTSVSAYRFLMINSEITAENCKSWYKQLLQDGNVVNIYTGWSISSTDGAAPVYDNSFTTVYTMIYDMINNSDIDKDRVIAVCHEMPFTVVTNANLSTSTSNAQNIDRSLKEKPTGSLVGSHTNKLNYSDIKANYWFSRLLEYFGVKLCIGGHKHTYACTNPLREFYYYTDGDTRKCSIDGPMTMTSTLQNDTVDFTTTVGVSSESDGTIIYTIDSETSPITINTSKFPLMQNSTLGLMKDSSVYFPCYGVASLSKGVTYFMCQATGYKLKSNKELPSPSQKFSYVIPKTDVGATSDTPNDNQQRPMFAEINLNNNQYTIYLYRIENIMVGNTLFSQLSYSTSPAFYKFLKGNESDGTNAAIYGNWGYTTKTPLVVV